MQGKFSIVVYNCMSGVCPALKSYYNVCLFCQHIRYFTFAFVSPVCSYYCLYHI